MRFLMLNWRDPVNPLAGGAERVSFRYLKALQERGHEVAWFANAFPGGAESELFEGIPIHRGGGRGTSIRHAVRWVRHQPRFDLVIDQHHGIPWFAPWWCGTRCIAYIHEVLGPIWNAFYPPPLNWVGRFQEWFVQVAYGGVPFWTPSESTRRRLLSRGIDRVRVFPNGVDTVPVSALDPKPITEPLRLVTVSRLAPNKRIDHAIRLVAELTQGGLEARLTVVGTGECEAELRRLTGEMCRTDCVTFAGRVSEEEKNRWLADAHFLVHPSQREGWGLNVLEANAMGTPAAVYPVDGLVDSTVADVTGLVTPAETPAALAESLTRLLQTPGRYAEMREAAWKRSFAFQWDKVLPPACDWLESMACGPE